MKKNKKRDDTPQEWLTNADLLYLGCRALFKYQNYDLWFPAIHLMVMCVEQYLKAYLKARCEGFPQRGIEGHKLTTLVVLCSSAGLKLSNDISEKIENIGKLWNLRYVDTRFEGEGLGEEELEALDEVVSSVRPQIKEFTGEGFIDRLNKSRTLHEILTWNNSFYASNGLEESLL